MKSLELQLKERLLIVEQETIEVNGENIDITESIKFGVEKLSKGKAEFLCLGSELTEDIAGNFVDESKYMDLDGNSGYVDYKVYPDGLLLNPLHSFISAVEAAGYNWGENPVKEVKEDDYYFEEDHGEFGKERLWDGGTYQQDLKEWQKSESRTFNPDKCIIFKILEK